jgi:hypothetical protein
MERRRSVAASPRRSASETWATIGELVTNSLSVSSYLDRAEISAALAVAGSVGRPLIAGGHLDREPVVLVAASLHLSVTTISGDDALPEVDGETAAVPGAATAKDWTLHLPTPEPLANVVKEAAKRNRHLSAEPAPESAEKASSTEALDFDALRRRSR